MTSISAAEMLRRLQPIAQKSWLENQVKEIVLSDNLALKKVKINEFEFGLRPNGKRIGEYANDNYAHKKNMQNSLAGYGNVDLIQTGAFVNSMFVFKNTKGFLFDASNDKKGKLIEQYGLDIMGLNQKTFNKRQKYIYKIQLSEEISRILNKK